jgi:DinB superfamily
MTLPAAIDAIWTEMEQVRAQVLAEAEGLSQAQVDWRPGPNEWSIGEILNHLTIAETHTGKLTTKLVREADTAGALLPYPSEVVRFDAVPAAVDEPAQAPPLVWPEHGWPLPQLVSDMKAVRERSRQSIERIATLDPRRLTFKHFQLGDLNVAQWWSLQARHDGVHLKQIRDVKASPGFRAAG